MKIIALCGGVGLSLLFSFPALAGYCAAEAVVKSQLRSVGDKIDKIFGEGASNFLPGRPRAPKQFEVNFDKNRMFVTAADGSSYQIKFCVRGSQLKVFLADRPTELIRVTKHGDNKIKVTVLVGGSEVEGDHIFDLSSEGEQLVTAPTSFSHN